MGQVNWLIRNDFSVFFQYQLTNKLEILGKAAQLPL